LGEYGEDKYDGLIIPLPAKGVDVAKAAFNTGHLQGWPHKGRRQLIKKPDWCESEQPGLEFANSKLCNLTVGIARNE
jgi:hypothetical protein